MPPPLLVSLSSNGLTDHTPILRPQPISGVRWPLTYCLPRFPFEEDLIRSQAPRHGTNLSQTPWFPTPPSSRPPLVPDRHKRVLPLRNKHAFSLSIFNFFLIIKNFFYISSLLSNGYLHRK